jgi:hypothetical protein
VTSQPAFVNASSRHAHSGECAALEEHTSIPVRDFATRLFLLGHLIAHVEGETQSNFPPNDADLRSEALERLRALAVADTVGFATGTLGISIQIDWRELLQQMTRAERLQADRQQYEGFVRRGASVRLLCRLFGVTEIETRRLRKLVVPEAAMGGRPRRPDDATCRDVCTTWRSLRQQQNLPERERWFQLAEAFPDVSIVSLEGVVAEMH